MKVTLTKDKDTLRIVDVESGIGLIIWDTNNLLENLDKEPLTSNKIEIQLREALREIVKEDPSLAVEVKDQVFTHTEAKIETVWR